jgi:hypothetical protein
MHPRFAQLIASLAPGLLEAAGGGKSDPRPSAASLAPPLPASSPGAVGSLVVPESASSPVGVYEDPLDPPGSPVEPRSVPELPLLLPELLPLLPEPELELLVWSVPN